MGSIQKPAEITFEIVFDPVVYDEMIKALGLPVQSPLEWALADAHMQFLADMEKVRTLRRRSVFCG